MKKIKIGIADDNREFCDILTDLLSEREDIDLVFVSHDGNKTIELIKTKQPVGEEYLAELAIPPAIVIPVAIIGGTILLVNVLRDLVYLFYNTRSKLSDHMKLMATFLEMNKANVEVNSSIPNEKRKKIIKKQADLAKTLRGLSEKIKVNDIMASNKAKMQKNDDNKAWKLDDVKADATNTQTGFQLL